MNTHVSLLLMLNAKASVAQKGNYSAEGMREAARLLRQMADLIDQIPPPSPQKEESETVDHAQQNQ